MPRAATPCPPPDVLELLALGKGSTDDVRSHVESCDSCRALISEIRTNEEFLQAFRPALRLDAPEASEDTVAVDPGSALAGAWSARPGSGSGGAGSGSGSGVLSIMPGSVEIPGYHNVVEISRGGQGIVYKAVHTLTKRKVAIKMLLHGQYASARELHRFEREIEIVAALRHPNIVTVFDSGVTPDHRPYVVMEYIHGLPLDRYVKEKLAKATKRSRWMYDAHTRLFQKIAAAVQHAHARGVIHRDLKPGNILVDDAGEPHIVDFGMARSLSLARGPAPTMTHEFGGTLAYASPEQVGGDPERIDVRTDVYSLGVIFYELLTGMYPYPVDGSISEIVRNIEHAEPVKPSSIEPSIGHEAETIVLKALMKEPERRYQSAGELARDVDDFLAGRPISARSNSALYLVGKLARRHRTKVLTGCLLTLLGIGCAGAVVVADRANVYADGVREGIKRILATMQLAKGDMNANQRFRAILDAADREVGGMFADLPDDEAQVREAIGHGYSELGDSRPAEAQFKRILEIREAAGAPLRDRVLLRIQLAQICAEYPTNRFDDALKYLDAGTIDAVRASGDKVLLAMTLRTIGNIRLKTDEAAAVPILEEARQVMVGVDDPGGVADGIESSLASYYLGAGEFQKALESYTRLYEKTRARFGDQHLNTARRLDLVADCEFQLKKYQEALKHYEQVHDVYARLMIPPDRRLADSLMQLSLASGAVGRKEDAERFAAQSRAMRQELERTAPRR